MSDNELGKFLRARREAVTPAEAGLPVGPRRRTPGLRRSELATLAGISVEYLIRLEQGRDRSPSTHVRAALAQALRLSPEERERLWRLSDASEAVPLCRLAAPPASAARPTVLALLRGLEPAPAVVLNRLGDVLAATSAWERLAGPLGMLEGEPPNLVRYVFTDPRARDAFPDWDRVADSLAAGFRDACGPGDPYFEALAAELTAAGGAEFSGRLAGSAALARGSGVERWSHPEAGDLRLAYESLALPDPDGQRVLAYLPADEATSEALSRLTRTGLRVLTA
ncbi:helix-turn-helix domain-containing protein [Bailinhaonella thermotolerans]|uniref:XRE family transcriptional regulator n=1 Tax=Bailinhaonella thermotolerans TaxID=1070861 RepID=A0A3A4BDA7_9ACTN|nr:helix-turn-helix transcriptional regulator [Bailinhaonella thermotolerans]RJL36086.1 XRE family transcriptional regulator [Bailinhaonella thermotolerans]